VISRRQGRVGQGRAGQGRAGQGFALKRSSIIWAQRRAVTGVLCSRLGLQFTSISHTFSAWSTTKSYPNSSWLLGRACRLSCTTNHPPQLCCIGCHQALRNQTMHFVKHDLRKLMLQLEQCHLLPANSKISLLNAGLHNVIFHTLLSLDAHCETGSPVRKSKDSMSEELVFCSHTA